MSTIETPGVTDAVDYDPFAGAEIARVVPTTEPQREIWLADRLGREASLAYNESILLRLRGPLDLAALRDALGDLAARHESLRSTVSTDGETLCIAAEANFAFEVRDAVPLEPRAREAAVESAAREAIESPFDLEHGPLMRATVVKLGDAEHVLVLTLHHIVCDGWSFGVLCAELGARYATRVGADAGELAPAPRYGDFAVAQRAFAGTAEFAADEKFWVSRFTGSLPTLDLPTDRPRAAWRTVTSRREDHVLDAGLIAEARKFSARSGTNLFAVLLGTFAGLMHRVSGAEDVVVGVPAAAQSQDGQEALVGHCVNLLPVRLLVEPGASAADLMKSAQGAMLDAYEHQRYTFGTLLRKLAIQRDPSRLPLVNVIFNVDQALDANRLGFTGLDVTVANNPRVSETFEIFINAVHVNGGLTLECQYNTDLFDAATVRRWLACYERLLRSACQEPARPLVELPMVAEDERRLMFDRWATAGGSWPVTQTLAEAFGRRAAADGARTALVLDRATLSYGELDGRANALAHRLRSLGVGPEVRVGLCMERSTDLLVAILGILKAGGAYVPLDPAYPGDRLAFMVEDSALGLVLAHEPTAPAAAAAIAQSGIAARVVRVDEAGSEARAIPPSGVTPDNAAYVIYTSGSTGKPKGVVVTHANVMRLFACSDALYGFGPDDAWTLFHSYAFDFSVWEIWGALLYGGRLVIVPHDVTRSPRDFLDLLVRERVTVLNQTPSAFYQLMAEDASRPAASSLALRYVVFGGEALDLARLEGWYERYGDAQPKLVNMYGITETTVHVTYRPLSRADVNAGQGSVIGQALPDLALYVLNPAGKPVPIGVPGEMYVGGAGVARGYLNRDALTAQRFVPNPFGAGRLYRSGDLARWRTDGELEYLGRGDMQVKVRGFRIELGEIEAQLLTYPGFTEVVVMAREDRPGDVRLVAYVKAPAGTVLDTESIRQHLGATLPSYMVPAHYVPLAVIPLTPNGKTDRKALPAPTGLAAVDRDYVGPRNDLERLVAAEMESALGMPGVSIHDDFFTLGGHSLLAAQLTSRLNRELGTHITMRTVFTAPTIARLAEAIAVELAAGNAPQRKPISRLSDRTVAPASVAQERLWFLEELNPGRVTYNAPSAHRLLGPLDERAFERAFRKMVRRQPSLRTSFERDGLTVVQRIHDVAPAPLFPAEDLSGLPESAREERLARRLEELTAGLFDLTRVPLYKARLFRLGPEEHAFYFMPHHIIWDGWSFDLLYHEMATLYGAYAAGREPALPELAVTYGDFAAWHRDWITGPEYAGQLEFWRGRLEKLGPVGDLPSDKPRGPSMSGAGNTEWMWVEKAHGEKLHALGQRAGTTLFTVGIALYAMLLHGYSGQSTLVIGTPVRGRNSLELESIMGFFNNLVPLQIEVDPAERFGAFLGRVKARVVEGLASPDVPLEVMATELATAGGTRGGTLLYQALFSFQDARQRIKQWGGLRHEFIRLFQKGATEDFGLWILEGKEGMQGGVTYNTDILEDTTAKSLRTGYLALMHAVVAEPDATVEALLERAQVARAKPEAAAEPARATRAAQGNAPETETEKLLAAIWCGTLKLASVSAQDNFFDLGGHSLLAMQAILAMEEKTSKRIDRGRYLFETLGQIARAYDAAVPEKGAKTGGVRKLLSGIFGGKRDLMGKTRVVPALAAHDVHVWDIDLAGEAPAQAASLDCAERERASRFAFERDRARYLRAHVAMRAILGSYLGVPPARVAFRVGEHGKPELEGSPGLAFNLSHSADAGLLAVGRSARIGVDIEARSTRADVRALARSVFTSAEAKALEGLADVALEEAFLRGWTRKEACLKALGVGLSVEPATFHAGLEADRRNVEVAAQAVEVETLPRSGDTVAAVAVAGGFARVTRLRWNR